MAESQIGSPMLKLHVPLILNPPDEAWFDIGLMHKDIRLVRQAGAEHGTLLRTAGPAGRRSGLDRASAGVARFRNSPPRSGWRTQSTAEVRTSRWERARDRIKPKPRRGS
jgi:hypothetical protein